MTVSARAAGPLRSLAAAATAVAVAALTGLATGGVSVAATPGPLTVTGRVALPMRVQDAPAVLVAAEAPDGTVYLGAAGKGRRQVLVVSGLHKPVVFATETAEVTALAADATTLFIATAHQVAAVDRTTGAQTRTWSVPAGKPTVSQLVVAGDRLWALMNDVQSYDPGPGRLLLIDPTKPAVVSTRTVTGVRSIAGNSTAVFGVGDKGSHLFRFGNDGSRTVAPTHQKLNLYLSGPQAIGVVAVHGSSVVAEYDAGQGLDATLLRYDANTLAGPKATAPFLAYWPIAETTRGLVVFSYLDETICGGTSERPGQCLSDWTFSKGKTGTPVRLTGAWPDAIVLGPQPVFVGVGDKSAVLIRLS